MTVRQEECVSESEISRKPMSIPVAAIGSQISCGRTIVEKSKVLLSYESADHVSVLPLRSESLRELLNGSGSGHLLLLPWNV